MVISTEQIINFLFGPFGTLFLCLLIIYTGYKGHWVFGWYAKELRTRNDRLENRVDQLSGAAKSVTSLVESDIGSREVTSDVRK